MEKYGKHFSDTKQKLLQLYDVCFLKHKKSVIIESCYKDNLGKKGKVFISLSFFYLFLKMKSQGVFTVAWIVLYSL